MRQWQIILPIVLAWVALIGAHAFAMRREQKFREFWGAAFLAFTPAFMSAVYLTGDGTMAADTRAVILGGFGAVLGGIAGVWISFITAGAATAESQTPPVDAPNGTIYNSGNRDVYNAPGGTIIVEPKAQSAGPLTQTSEEIYQAGVIVGKAYGGRRSPRDATTFEFAEITNCTQLNTTKPFIFNGVKLQFISEKDSAMMVVGRNDNPIRFGVLARVIE